MEEMVDSINKVGKQYKKREQWNDYSSSYSSADLEYVSYI